MAFLIMVLSRKHKKVKDLAYNICFLHEKVEEIYLLKAYEEVWYKKWTVHTTMTCSNTAFLIVTTIIRYLDQPHQKSIYRTRI